MDYITSLDKNEETFQEQIALIVRALRADQENVRDLAIAQLSFLGKRATPYLIGYLERALEEADLIKEKRFTDYKYRSPVLGPEYEINGVLRTFWLTMDTNATSSILKAFPRREAVFALARLGTLEALDILITTIPHWYKPRNRFGKLCEDGDVNILFSYFGKEKGIRLRNYLEKADSETKVKILQVLTLVSDAETSEVSLDQLNNKNIKVKIEAVQTLRKLKAKEAVPRLIDELFKVTEKMRDRRPPINLVPLIKELGEAIAELGEIEDWLNVVSRLPHISISSLNTKIINSGEAAIPGLMKMYESPDKSVHLISVEMITRIKHGETIPEKVLS